jgi:gluconolactonase
VLDNVPYPNGIALSPDGALAYVAATRANAVWRFGTALPEQGPPMAGTYVRLSGGLGPDGLAVDAAGRLAVAHAQAGRAFVFDALGDPLVEIRLPEGLWTTSVAFPPAERDTVYIVEAQTGSVYVADFSQVAESQP